MTPEPFCCSLSIQFPEPSCSFLGTLFSTLVIYVLPSVQVSAAGKSTNSYLELLHIESGSCSGRFWSQNHLQVYQSLQNKYTNHAATIYKSVVTSLMSLKLYKCIWAFQSTYQFHLRKKWRAKKSNTETVTDVQMRAILRWMWVQFHFLDMAAVNAVRRIFGQVHL
jgi:hypothetical protein